MAGGKKAYKYGHAWEEIVDAEALRQGVGLIKLPSVGAKMAGKRLVPQKMPFDRIIFHDTSAVFLDCKTFDKDVLNYSDIDPNQADHLEHLDRRGIVAGYIIWMRKSKGVYFCRGRDLLSAINLRARITTDEMVLLGTFDSFCLTRLFSLPWERDYARST